MHYHHKKRVPEKTQKNIIWCISWYLAFILHHPK